MFNEEEAFVSPDADVFGEREHKPFKLHSNFAPTGDQPQAIEELVEGFKEVKPV